MIIISTSPTRAANRFAAAADTAVVVLSRLPPLSSSTKAMPGQQQQQDPPAAQEDLLDFLIDSARYGDSEDVQTAIREGVAVDGQDAAGRTGAPRQAGRLVALCGLCVH